MYPALTPWDIDNRPFDMVIDLFSDVRRMQIHEDKEESKPKIIRRPAGDNWW